MSNRIILSPSAFRISKPGKDITSTNLDDYFFHENVDNSTLLLKGIIITLQYDHYDPVSFPNATTVYYKSTIAHNLGYIPFLVCYKFQDDYITIDIDNTNIVFSISSYMYLTAAPTTDYTISGIAYVVSTNKWV